MSAVVIQIIRKWHITLSQKLSYKLYNSKYLVKLVLNLKKKNNQITDMICLKYLQID